MHPNSLKRINSLQHIGMAAQDMDKTLRFCRKFIGLDIPFFDSVAPAPLMKVYTRGETIIKRASMIMNLKGGCAMEVIRPTSFEPVKASFDVNVGDIGIFMVQVKCPDARRAYEYCANEKADGLTALNADPAGSLTFSIVDPDGHIFQFVEATDWFTRSRHPSGGLRGCSIGVSDMEKSLGLYKDILGYDRIVYDKSGSFDDWSGLPGGNERYRRVLLTQSAPSGGGFARLIGQTSIELVQALDRSPRKIFKGRIWGDTGFVHLGFDVKGMKGLGEELEKAGYSFRCDSKDVLNMGNTRVHCTYIDDPDGTLIELIEVYKVPIVERWGIFLDVEKRDPLKPLPNFMLKALRFSRIKDK